MFMPDVPCVVVLLVSLVTIEDNLVNEDPTFVAPQAGNFQLREDSPAWKLGFQRIPVEKIGPYEDDGRATWPAKHRVRAADYWMTLFKHPRYLCVEGKPLLVIVSPRGNNAEGLAYLQEAARKAGFPGVAVAGWRENRLTCWGASPSGRRRLVGSRKSASR